MSQPVNSRVTPALDPETYKVEGYNDETRGYVDDVVTVFGDIYATLGKLHEARDLWERNPAATPEQRVLVVAKEADKQKDRLARRLDRACRDLDARIGQTEADMARPVQLGAAAGPLSAEVRAHFKSVNSEQRSKLLREALAADDEATLQSVLGAQPFLSGMTNVDRDHFTAMYHAKKSPRLVERLDVMRRVRDLMATSGGNGGAFHQAFVKVVGAKPNDVRAISNANEAALAALRIDPVA